MKVLGMMSGTSADGIDVAILEIFGFAPNFEWKLLFHNHVSFAEKLRKEIFLSFRPETGTVDRICRLNFEIGKALGNAALETIQKAGMEPADIDLIGSHGQTIWHIPADQAGASTLQIGEPAVIAEICGIPVVSNFRTADMAAGGHGAPLVSFTDVMLLSSVDKVRAAQNIGGIANVTYIPRKEDNQHLPLAFDTGPGNMLIDDAVERISDGQYHFDRDGKIAASGKIDADFLNEMLSDPYYSLQPPKTTGREYFGVQFGEKAFAEAKRRGIRNEDYVATMTALTAESISRAYHDFLPEYPQEVIVHGGGTLNPELMLLLRERLAPALVYVIDDFGLPAEAKEAAAFALMAYQTWHHLPGNIPPATNASHPVIMGNITLAPIQEQANPINTEMRNIKTAQIDEISTMGIVQLINQEDKKVPYAIQKVLPQIAEAVDGIYRRMKTGGRLIYIGAGTSGRLGVLDASEIPPTYGASPDLVIGMIAGGKDALTNAIEGAEDDLSLGARDIQARCVSGKDCVVGIAASGNTPYVLGGLDEAKKRGALTIGIACSQNARIIAHADIPILPIPGAEVISGSTRMKAGSVQKMVLNMLSTAVMIKLGKTYSNLMIDVTPSNQKLIDRQQRIVADICEIDKAAATELLKKCDGEVKTAIITYKKQVTPQQARKLLEKVDGHTKAALCFSD